MARAVTPLNNRLVKRGRPAGRAQSLACALIFTVPGAAFCMPALASPAAAPPSFYAMSGSGAMSNSGAIPNAGAPVAEPRLGAAPDVIEAFSLDRTPGLFSNHAAVTPELPRLSG